MRDVYKWFRQHSSIMQHKHQKRKSRNHQDEHGKDGKSLHANIQRSELGPIPTFCNMFSHVFTIATCVWPVSWWYVGLAGGWPMGQKGGLSDWESWYHQTSGSAAGSSPTGSNRVQQAPTSPVHLWQGEGSSTNRRSIKELKDWTTQKTSGCMVKKWWKNETWNHLGHHVWLGLSWLCQDFISIHAEHVPTNADIAEACLRVTLTEVTSSPSSPCLATIEAHRQLAERLPATADFHIADPKLFAETLQARQLAVQFDDNSWRFRSWVHHGCFHHGCFCHVFVQARLLRLRVHLHHHITTHLEMCFWAVFETFFVSKSNLSSKIVSFFYSFGPRPE